jgi:hypothetical protein
VSNHRMKSSEPLSSTFAIAAFISARIDRSSSSAIAGPLARKLSRISFLVVRNKLLAVIAATMPLKLRKIRRFSISPEVGANRHLSAFADGADCKAFNTQPRGWRRIGSFGICFRLLVF